MLVLALALACTPSQVQITQEPCGGTDLDDPSVLDSDVDGTDLLVWRTNAFEGRNDLFQPEIEIDRSRIVLREAWEIDPSEEETLCWFPGLRMEHPPREAYTIEWYTDLENEPFLTGEVQL